MKFGGARGSSLERSTKMVIKGPTLRRSQVAVPPRAVPDDAFNECH